MRAKRTLRNTLGLNGMYPRREQTRKGGLPLGWDSGFMGQGVVAAHWTDEQFAGMPEATAGPQ